jgi:hypothetical protein
MPSRVSVLATLVIGVVLLAAFSGVASPRLASVAITKRPAQTVIQACRELLPGVRQTSDRLTLASGELAVAPATASADAHSVLALFDQPMRNVTNKPVLDHLLRLRTAVDAEVSSFAAYSTSSATGEAGLQTATTALNAALEAFGSYCAN